MQICRLPLCSVLWLHFITLRAPTCLCTCVCFHCRLCALWKPRGFWCIHRWIIQTWHKSETLFEHVGLFNQGCPGLAGGSQQFESQVFPTKGSQENLFCSEWEFNLQPCRLIDHRLTFMVKQICVYYAGRIKWQESDTVSCKMSHSHTKQAKQLRCQSFSA